MSYLIINRNEWSGLRPVCQEDGCEAVTAGELRGAVEARTGRSRLLANKNVAARLRSTGRVYIAADGGRPGVVIEAVNHPAIAGIHS